MHVIDFANLLEDGFKVLDVGLEMWLNNYAH